MSAISVQWYRSGALPPDELPGLAELFAGVAGEFHPPLTQRSGTTQSGLRDLGPESSTGPTDQGSYFEEMMEQDLLIARSGGELVGFLSFRPRHEDVRYAKLCPCFYVSTIAVRPDLRRAGVARKLYEHLFALPADLPHWVVLRTWSTNSGHLRLLDALGFSTVLVLPDDRGPGVDTVYLAVNRSGRGDPLSA